MLLRGKYAHSVATRQAASCPKRSDSGSMGFMTLDPGKMAAIRRVLFRWAPTLIAVGAVVFNYCDRHYHANGLEPHKPVVIMGQMNTEGITATNGVAVTLDDGELPLAVVVKTSPPNIAAERKATE